ncbi:hypothetical protein CF327_g5518 [Tilletia walkeri]|nr:hypothetical protein CF327_g5518 [Tilletia walkeri]
MGKKRPTLKSNAQRGFATSSVPKKQEPAPEAAAAGEGDAKAPNGSSTQAASPAPAGPNSTQEAPTASASQDAAALLADAERQELQELVERVMEKADREAARIWKIIEFDQRLSSSLTSFELSVDVRDRILAHFAEAVSAGAEVADPLVATFLRPVPLLNPSAPESASPFIKPAEAHLRQLHRALITHTLLVNLGFSPHLADWALRFAPSLELEDCLSYLVLVIPSELLEDRAQLSTFQPALAASSQSERAAPQVLARDDAVDTSRPPPHYGISFSRLPVSNFDALERERRRRAKEEEDTAEAAKIAAREARIARKKAEAEGGTTANGSSIEQPNTNNDDAEGSDDEPMFGDMLDEIPDSVIDNTEQGDEVKIEVRTIPPVAKGAVSSKNSPQTLLNDAIHRIDEFAIAKFHRVPGAGRICRSRLEIRWSSKGSATMRAIAGGFTQLERVEVPVPPSANAGSSPALQSAGTDGQDARGANDTGSTSPTDEATQLNESFVDIYALTGIATATQPTAEDLVAIAALHTIESERPVQRSLSTAYRQWWDELEGMRKEQKEEARRRRVAVIQTVLTQRSEEIARGNTYQPPATKKLNAKPSDAAVGTRTIVNGTAPTEQNGDASGATKVDDATVEQPSPVVRNESVEKEFAALVNTPSYQKMLIQRKTLPISAYREHILEIVDNSPIFVLSGETGCGKSTQVPAFVLEHCMSRGQPCKIYVTEPRRISAISLAERVSAEMGEASGAVGSDSSMVGYAIRLESQVGRRARLVYATTGIVLRMLEGNAFNEITHIIIDEVHERSIESDFLLIVLKTLLEHRKDLKVILMSATVDAERISAYCGGCPTISIPGRTFPVDVRFLEDAIELCDYVLDDSSQYAFRDKRRKGMPRTGVEVQNKAHLASQDDEVPVDLDEDEGEEERSSNKQLAGTKYRMKTISTLDRMDENAINHDLIVQLIENICTEPGLQSFSQAILVFMPGLMEIRRCHDLLQAHPLLGTNDFRIYPLHSTISSDLQSAVFDIPPKGVRKIVIATNIAETGITIPDITCVIDTGKHREMRFDEKRQISKLVECFVARSNAKQRRGRAGRVQEGLCFHLFTKHRHDQYLAEHPQPEMLRLSLQELALKLKIMKIKIGDSIQDALTQALDPPTEVNVQRAVAALIEVKALTTTEEITPLGRHLSRMPLDVHMGKFLLIASMMRCLDPALTIAAALNSKSPFVTPFGREDEADLAKSSFKAGDSDFLTVANAFNAWRRSCGNNHHWQFCNRTFLSHQTLQQIEDLRQQYMAYLLDSGFVKVDDATSRAIARLRYRAGSTGGKPRLMQLPDDLNVNSGSIAVINAAMAAALYPKMLSVDNKGLQLRTIGNNAPASIHPSSVNRRLRFHTLPKTIHYLLYFTMMQNSKKRMFAWDTSPVDDRALLLMCGDANFYLAANSVYIDRQKVRFSVADAKTVLALRLLRDNLWRLINATFRAPRKTWLDEQQDAFLLAIDVLGCRAGPADAWQPSSTSAP